MNNNSKNNGMVDGEKTRRKRLKVVSACGECRRKKTKCNGEKPCAGCLKARVECKYVYQKPNGLGVFTAAATVTVAKPIKKPTSSTTMTEMMNDGNNKNNMKSSPQPMPPPSSSSSLSISTSTHSPPLSTTSSSTISIEAIEERLGAIENILRTLLGSSSKNKHFLHGLQHPQPPPQQALCGDMYTSTSPYLVHAPPIQNRSLPREKRKRHDIDGEGVTDSSNNKRVFVREDIGHGYHQRLQLAPIKILNQSPATPTIRNLLNTEEMDEKRWYPSSSVQQQTTPPPPTHHTSSAFYRMSSSTNNNSATTAAGSLS